MAKSKGKKTIKSKGNPSVSLLAKMKSKPEFVFVFLFVAGLAIFYSIWSQLKIDGPILGRFINLTASASSVFLNLFGFATEAFGDRVQNASFAVDIKAGCDGIEPIAFYAVSILAYPAIKARKIVSIITGVALLFLINLIRVGSLFVIGLYLPDYFEIFHAGVWQVVFVALVALMWLAWYNKFVSKRYSNPSQNE